MILHAYVVWGRVQMANPTLVRAVGKLAMAGEQAGFSLEEMIAMLNSGVSVLTLFALISRRLQTLPTRTVESLELSSRGIM